jgi:RNase H-fold protein (predicted Holliday junction resolvase)
METKVTLSIDFGYKNVGVPNEEKTTKDFTPVAAVEKK